MASWEDSLDKGPKASTDNRWWVQALLKMEPHLLSVQCYRPLRHLSNNHSHPTFPAAASPNRRHLGTTTKRCKLSTLNSHWFRLAREILWQILRCMKSWIRMLWNLLWSQHRPKRAHSQLGNRLLRSQSSLLPYPSSSFSANNHLRCTQWVKLTPTSTSICNKPSSKTKECTRRLATLCSTSRWAATPDRCGERL